LPPTNSLTPTKRLQFRALLGGAWVSLGFGVQKIVQLASNLILTRLLFPDAFGLMSLANVLLIGLAMFSDIGIKPAIVQHKDGDTTAFLNTAWTLQIVRGFGLWFVACALAYPASLLYGEPVLFPLICVLGATAAINGFSTTALAVKEKRIDFAALTIVQTVGSVSTLCVTAAFAWWLRSVWALAYGAILGALINLVIGYIMAPSHPHRLELDRDALSSMMRFGRWILLGTLATYLGGNGLRAVQGALVPITAFGVLSIAQTIAWMPGEFVSQIAGAVGFASMAEVNTKGGNLFAALRKVRAVSLGLAIPAFILLALASHQIMAILYDSRYSDAGGYVGVLALSGALAVLPIGYQNTFLAQGRSRLHFNMMFMFAVTRLIGVGAGFALGGIYGMMIGEALSTLWFYGVGAVLAHRSRIFDGAMDAAALTAIAITSVIIYWRDFGS
jgi:O-antigen/teichoic acid export membrane protein